MAGRPLPQRLGIVALELAILGLAWYLLGLPELLVGGLAAIILVAGLVPERFASAATGLGFVSLGAVILYLYPGSRNIAILLLVAGAVFLAIGVASLARRPPG